MQYLTACYGRQGEETSSLLLLQFQCREIPVCLAYLADGNERDENSLGGEAADRLRLWCRSFPWPRAVRRPGSWLERAKRELAQEVGCPGIGVSRRSLLLAIGEDLLLMGGGQPAYLINTAYGRGCAELLQPDVRGILEVGAGILLTTSAFSETLRPDLLGEALCPAELREEAQAERRLRELAAQAQQETGQGGEGGTACRKRTDGQAAKKGERAAILLVTRESGGM